MQFIKTHPIYTFSMHFTKSYPICTFFVVYALYVITLYLSVNGVITLTTGRILNIVSWLYIGILGYNLFIKIRTHVPATTATLVFLCISTVIVVVSFDCLANFLVDWVTWSPDLINNAKYYAWYYDLPTIWTSLDFMFIWFIFSVVVISENIWLYYNDTQKTIPWGLYITVIPLAVSVPVLYIAMYWH